MHHSISGVNSQIHSVSLASHVSTQLLIHLSAHLYHHHHSHHTSFLQSFTPGSKLTFSTNPSHLNTFSTPGLPSQSWDWTGHIMLKAVNFSRQKLKQFMSESRQTMKNSQRHVFPSITSYTCTIQWKLIVWVTLHVTNKQFSTYMCYQLQIKTVRPSW